MKATNRRIRARVFGLVQGVFYRASTQREARALGLSGWVRNTRDGAVELEAQGSAAAVEALLTWCHTGPPAARVDRVEVTEAEPLAQASGFDIRY